MNKQSSARRLWWLLPVMGGLALLLTVVYLFFPRLLNPDPLIRFFRYLGLRDQAHYGVLDLEAGAAGVYAGFDDGLLVGTESGLTLYSLEGEQKALVQGSLPTPVLRTGGSVALLYSPGSAFAAAVGAGGTVLMEEALTGAILNADISVDGYTAYLTAETGYKTVATVLNPDWEPIYRFSSRTRYLNACAVSPQGTLLAVARLEEEEGAYRTSITLLPTDQAIADLDQEGETAVRVNLGNQLVYELHFLDRSHLLAVAQDEILFLDTEGRRLGSVSMMEGTLTDYAVSREGWVILAFGENGGGARVVTYSAQGEQLGELDLADRVRSVSAAGRYAAVLTETWVQTYDRVLEPYDRSWDVLGVNRAIARTDGTVLLLGSGATKLYIP